MPDEPLRPDEHDHLPRLPPGAYRGRAVVHWTLTIENRRTGWLTTHFHEAFRWLLLHGCARYEVACPLYCLMPDHAHLIVVGWTRAADQLLFMPFLRKHTGLVLQEAGCKWQKQPYDHVMQERETDRFSFESLAHYISHNPVRAGLVCEPHEWAFTGNVLPGYPEMNLWMGDYWQRYWRITASRIGG